MQPAILSRVVALSIAKWGCNLLGLALLSVVTSSLILLDVSPYWQDVIKGLILLAAVTIDHLMNTRKTKR